MLDEGGRSLREPQRLSASTAGSMLLIGLGYGLCFLLLFQAAKVFETSFSVSLWYPAAGLRLAALLWFGWRFGCVAFVAELAAFQILAVTHFADINDVWLLRGDGAVTAGRLAALLAAAASPPCSYALAVLVTARLPLAPFSHRGIVYIARLCCAGALGATLAAVSTCLVIAASGLIAWTELPGAISAFWIGDCVGVLAWAPAAGIAARRWLGNRAPALPGESRIAPPPPVTLGENSPSRVVILEALFVCALTALLLRTTDIHNHSVDWYPLMLPVIWSAFRRGLDGAIAAGFAVGLAVAALLAIHLASDARHVEARDVQVFMIVVSLTGLMLGAFASALREERATLEQRVRDRTHALADEVERRRHAEVRAVAEWRRAESYLNMSRAAIIACDRDGLMTMANAEACAILGRDRHRLEGMPFLAGLIPPERRQPVALGFASLLDGTEAASTFASPIVRPDGEWIHVEWRAVRITDESGTMTGILLAGIDVTDRLRGEEEARYLATHDALTGLYNRRMLPEITTGALARARRHGSGVAVLFADLNGFKRINDTSGHAAGDRILIETARRITARVRETDRVIRFGGDEFVVVLEDIADTRASARLGVVIARAITRPITVEASAIRVGVAVGISCYPQHGTTPSELLAAADAAMYARKRRPGSGIQLAVNPHADHRFQPA